MEIRGKRNSRPGRDESPEDPKGEAGKVSTAQKSVNKLVAAALVALGVPPAVAARIAPLVTKAVSVAVAFGMLLGLAVFSGGLQSDVDPVDDTEAYKDAPSPIVSALKSISYNYQIPERVLLGIALTQTNYGKISPYDGSDRTAAEEDGKNDLSVFPTVKPAIGNADKDEGLGMFLVTPTGAKELDVNAQNVEETATALAKYMSTRYRELLRATPKARTDPGESDKLWLTVLDELPLVDPAGSLFNCPLPDGDVDLGDSVSTVMQCVLGKAPSLAAVRVVKPSTQGGTWILRYRYGSDALSQINREALAVSYAQAVKINAITAPLAPGGAAQPAPAVDAPPAWPTIAQMKARCSGLSTSIFPMDKKVWEAYTEKNPDADPCDALPNITAMAEWLVKQAVPAPKAFTINPEKPYDVETLLWKDVPLAVGSTDELEKFRKEGPASGYLAPRSCVAQVQTSLRLLSEGTVGDPVRAYATALSTSAEQIAAKEALWPAADAVIRSVPRDTSLLCAYESRLPSERDWFKVLQTAAAQLQSSFAEELDPADASRATTFFAGFAEGSARLYDQYVIRRPVSGTDPFVVRYSSQQLDFTVPPVIRSRPPATLSGHSQRILDNILWLGGIVKGDPRAGQQPAGLLSTLGAIGIAVETQYGSPVILTQDSRLVNANPCNGGGGILSADMATRWNALCAAATADGIDLYANSTWRSYQTQLDLYNDAGSKTAAAPCTGGEEYGCPHQRGAAIDVSTGMGDTPADDEDPVFKWVHSIVGCVDIPNKAYKQLSTIYTPNQYTSMSTPPCGALQPVKRMQLFGLVVLCRGGKEEWSNPAVIQCRRWGTTAETTLGGTGGHWRERWHLDLGKILIPAGGIAGNIDCAKPVPINPDDRQSVAYATRHIFYCKLAARGLTALAPVGTNAYYPASSKYKNLAEQIASEAVMVAYCESNFTPSSGVGDKYTGVFQMGPSEFERFSGGLPIEMKGDPQANIAAAAEYWLYGFERHSGGGYWGGWGPWAVVNTSYGGSNDAVELPILSRIATTTPGIEGQYSRAGIPNWATAPEQFFPPKESCGHVWKNSTLGKWSDADPKILAGVTIAPPPGTASTKSIGVVGDSLSTTLQTPLSASTALSGRDAQVWAKTSQSIGGEAITQVKSYAASRGTVVVALGTNDSAGGISVTAAKTRINSVMAAAGSKKVLWVNVWRAPEDTTAHAGAVNFNKALSQVAAANSKLVVLDWFGAVEASAATYRASYMAPDRIHLNAAGYEWRAAWLARNIATQAP
jgi:lysophospholipase L1-like esterase